jgi:hypothetical protein
MGLVIFIIKFRLLIMPVDGVLRWCVCHCQPIAIQPIVVAYLDTEYGPEDISCSFAHKYLPRWKRTSLLNVALINALNPNGALGIQAVTLLTNVCLD